MLGKNKKLLEKQHYSVFGKNSGVQICRWTKKSLLNEGECYKQKFYGIESHRCCQMSPCVLFCQNKCLHCWRAIENTEGIKLSKKDSDTPTEVIEGCINAQRKLLMGFKGNNKTNMKKWEEAQNPNQFAISLSGEPTLYPYLPELVSELRARRCSTFIVTNGLNPKILKKMLKMKILPTQIYLSMNTPYEKLYNPWHRSSYKNAWKKFNETLFLFKKLKRYTRTVIRMTLVRKLNMKPEQAEDYAKLIKKAEPMFIEVKGYMSVGYARHRLPYETMPTMEEVENYSKLIAKKTGYKIFDKQNASRVVLLGKNKKNMKIKKI
jgi:tRNA wybutosine-synthesizing protein 1